MSTSQQRSIIDRLYSTAWTTVDILTLFVKTLINPAAVDEATKGNIRGWRINTTPANTAASALSTASGRNNIGGGGGGGSNIHGIRR